MELRNAGKGSRLDVLLTLDACRYYLFCEVAPKYEFLHDDPVGVYSPASQSREWMARHFQTEQRHETNGQCSYRVTCSRARSW